MGWLGGWAKRIKVTVDAGDIDADLANFPILVYISAISGINAEDISCVFDELTSDANRKKIAVTTDDGTTQCYVEIEEWDDANEQAYLWVKVPAIDDAVNTDLYLYYDHTQADNTTYVGDTNSTPAETVWDANYKHVYHMRDGADTSHIYDSTGNNGDGTKTGAAEPAVNTGGKISDCQLFDGSNDKIVGPTGDGYAAVSVELWVKKTSNTGVSMLVCHGTDAAANTGSFRILTYAGHHQYFVGNTGAYSVDVASDLSTTVWTHLALTFNSTDFLKTFKDGASDGTDGTGAYTDASKELSIGYQNYGPSWYYYAAARLDEVRVSNIARSDAWIKAGYETGRDHLLDWGTEETAGVTIKKGSGLVATMTEMLNSKMLFSACNRFPKLTTRRF